jgi:hypothetical protein
MYSILAMWERVAVLDAMYSVPQASSYVNPTKLVQLWEKLLPDKRVWFA